MVLLKFSLNGTFHLLHPFTMTFGILSSCHLPHPLNIAFLGHLSLTCPDLDIWTIIRH